MPNHFPAVMNWSGGKDSTLALHYVLQENEFDVRYLLTTVNETFDRIVMHGVRERLLLEQIRQLGLPLRKVSLPEMPDMETYEKIMGDQMAELKMEGISHSIYGDIFLEDLKAYREKQLAKHSMNAVFPLWKKDSKALVKEFIELGYQSIIVCAQDGLQDFCGRIIDPTFLDDLPKGIDPCGENGEFHTFVFNGPIFKKPVSFELGEKVYRPFPNQHQSSDIEGYWYIDCIPSETV
jgi:uncharacterized protein (TIGR00290 family)